jgi:hypothetical protein
MRTATKVLVTIEVVVCFAPVVLMLLLGVVVAPVQIYQAIADPLNWRAANNEHNVKFAERVLAEIPNEHT